MGKDRGGMRSVFVMSRPPYQPNRLQSVSDLLGPLFVNDSSTPKQLNSVAIEIIEMGLSQATIHFGEGKASLSVLRVKLQRILESFFSLVPPP